MTWNYVPGPNIALCAEGANRPGSRQGTAPGGGSSLHYGSDNKWLSSVGMRSRYPEEASYEAWKQPQPRPLVRPNRYLAGEDADGATAGYVLEGGMAPGDCSTLRPSITVLQPGTVEDHLQSAVRPSEATGWRYYSPVVGPVPAYGHKAIKSTKSAEETEMMVMKMYQKLGLMQDVHYRINSGLQQQEGDENIMVQVGPSAAAARKQRPGLQTAVRRTRPLVPQYKVVTQPLQPADSKPVRGSKGVYMANGLRAWMPTGSRDYDIQASPRPPSKSSTRKSGFSAKPPAHGLAKRCAKAKGNMPTHTVAASARDTTASNHVKERRDQAAHVGEPDPEHLADLVSDGKKKKKKTNKSAKAKKQIVVQPAGQPPPLRPALPPLPTAPWVARMQPPMAVASPRKPSYMATTSPPKAASQPQGTTIYVSTQERSIPTQARPQTPRSTSAVPLVNDRWSQEQEVPHAPQVSSSAAAAITQTGVGDSHAQVAEQAVQTDSPLSATWPDLLLTPIWDLPAAPVEPRVAQPVQPAARSTVLSMPPFISIPTAPPAPAQPLGPAALLDDALLLDSPSLDASSADLAELERLVAEQHAELVAKKILPPDSLGLGLGRPDVSNIPDNSYAAALLAAPSGASSPLSSGSWDWEQELRSLGIKL